MEILSILGLTASGKSAVAFELAKQVQAEIVSCDSMMVYRGMDIGTAKPTPAQQGEIRHHLIDIADISERYNLRRYLDDAAECLAVLEHEAALTILCGGTGLYAKALLAGFTLRPHNADVAHQLRQEISEGRENELLAELRRIDPHHAQAATNNPRRLVRYLEVARITGLPLDKEAFGPTSIEDRGRQWVLMPSVAVARERIIERTRNMLASGWIDETETLVQNGLLESPTASQALGYRRICDFLRGAIRSVSELEELIVADTCRYAKRQRTWFRRQHPKARIIHIEQRTDINEIVEVITADLDGAGMPGNIS